MGKCQTLNIIINASTEVEAIVKRNYLYIKPKFTYLRRSAYSGNFSQNALTSIFISANFSSLL